MLRKLLLPHLQNLSRNKYKDLYDIIYLPVETKEKYEERTKKFRSYLSDDENLSKFLEIFPIILATNLSCTCLGTPKPQFNIVMMDEAGQCNVANALIPIVRGEQLILVGDPQQLRPVVVLDETINRSLKEKYNIPDEYDYIKNSVYTLFTQIDLTSNETLLSYHYRCHDKIIGFSNKKYYHSKLKLKGKSKEEQPLRFIDTSKRDKLKYFGKKNVSEIEAKEICKFIKENSNLSIGIITPFVHQKECIEFHLKQNQIDDITVGTVHAFQGDQKDVILFSTAITNSTQKGSYDPKLTGINYGYKLKYQPGKVQSLKFKQCMYKIKNVKGKLENGTGNLNFLSASFSEPKKIKEYNFDKFTGNISNSNSAKTKKVNINKKHIDVLADAITDDVDPIQTNTSDSKFLFDNEDAIVINLKKTNKKN